ncbi:hypothetical protein pb186bvf_005277 [Paramecium bursaria]
MMKLFEYVAQPKNPKILAIGKNYINHVLEMGQKEPPEEPIIFQKPSSSVLLVTAQNNTLKLPDFGHEIHHELELGVVIGLTGKSIDQSKAFEYIGGYFLALDLTDRTLQAKFKAKGLPWCLAKGQDGFLPVSGYIEPKKVRDPHELQLKLKINGKTVQDDSTGSMIYKVDQIISYISMYMTLNPGDLILTGTPAGVGPIKKNDKLVGTLHRDDELLTSIELNIA